MPICYHCKIEKPIEDFFVSRARASRAVGRNSCKACHRAAVKAKRQTPAGRDKYNAYRRTWSKKQRRVRREKVIAAYGGKCGCCGETEYVFLTLDHVNDDGNEHRKRQGNNGGSEMAYIDAIRREFPSDYQILCFNCNYAKYAGGCPHQNQRR